MMSNILTRVVFDHRIERMLGTMTGRRHDRFMVLQADLLQYDVGHARRLGAQKGFGIASAVLKLQPHNL